MAGKDVLHLTLTMKSKEMDDRWELVCDELGVFAYGETLKEADDWMKGAVLALLNSFYGDDAEMGKWLQLKGVSYRFGEDTLGDPTGPMESVIGTRASKDAVLDMAAGVSGIPPPHG